MTKPLLILVIDDSKAIHALIRSRLQDEPYSIASSFTAADALAAARELDPDLILLDDDLPDMTGLEASTLLKSDPSTRDIPIIFLTSAVSPDDPIFSPETAAADFLAKPLHPAELRARIHRALHARAI